MEVLVVGDSWASAVEGDTKKDAGWPDILGVDPEYQQGVGGTTAYQWSHDHNGMLTKARETECDTLIVSLMGNDARAALSDGKVTHDEVLTALGSMRNVLNWLCRKRTFVILYADPFSGKNTQSRAGIPILNAAIRFVVQGDAHFIDLGEILMRKGIGRVERECFLPRLHGFL